MDKKAVKVVKEFIKKLKKRILIEKVIFFGSRTGEDFMNYSDIDLIIVSEYFENIDFDERMKIMYNYWNFDYAVDFLCYTPDEFDRLSKMMTIVREALKTGLVIK